MSPETFASLFLIASAASWTPGPNNLMLASSGVNFGFRRTLPHLAGIWLGFPAMIVIVALGLGGLFSASGALREAARWAGGALLLWFAWRIATAGRAEARSRSRPLSFAEAAGFQWINPKAWAMALATTSQFVTGRDAIAEALLCAAAYALTGLFSSMTWTMFGVAIRRFLNNPLRLRIFNIVMGLLIASFVVALFAGET